MESVYLYDATTIDSYRWPDTHAAIIGRKYLLPLIKEGVTPYISNVTTKIYLVACEDIFLPITVNEEEYENSYVASNYYGLCLYEEWLAQKHPIFLKCHSCLLKMGKKMMKWVKINKCVLLNNWLMTNNLPIDISSTTLTKIVAFLAEKFPHHVIIYRNLGTSLLRAPKESKFHILKTRQVYFYDPSKKGELSAKATSHHRKDRHLLEKHGLTFFQSEDVTEKDLPRLLALYEKVYVQKHTSYSPRYTEKFLKNALEQQLFRFIGVKKEGRIDGIAGCFTKEGTMIVPFFGYDIDSCYSGELYRLLTVLILEEAERQKVILNDSSGGEKTKKYRGLKPESEYIAIYEHHLPWLTRSFWAALVGIIYLMTLPTKKR